MKVYVRVHYDHGTHVIAAYDAHGNALEPVETAVRRGDAGDKRNQMCERWSERDGVDEVIGERLPEMRFY